MSGKDVLGSRVNKKRFKKVSASVLETPSIQTGPGCDSPVLAVLTEHYNKNG